MALLKTFYDGKSSQMKYSKHFDTGIYFTDLDSHISYNCKNLKIRLDKLDNEWDDMDIIHEYDTFFVLTSRVNMKYKQHIFLNSAAKGDIWEFAEKMPKKIAQQIFKAACIY